MLLRVNGHQAQSVSLSPTSFTGHLCFLQTHTRFGAVTRYRAALFIMERCRWHGSQTSLAHPRNARLADRGSDSPASWCYLLWKSNVHAALSDNCFRVSWVCLNIYTLSSSLFFDRSTSVLLKNSIALSSGHRDLKASPVFHQESSFQLFGCPPSVSPRNQEEEIVPMVEH